MKPLVISRATVASSRCDPAQWSSNLQLAINSGSQITLLDPQVPLIHQSVYAIPDQETQNKSLDPKVPPSTPIYYKNGQFIGQICFYSMMELNLSQLEELVNQ